MAKQKKPRIQRIGKVGRPAQKKERFSQVINIYGGQPNYYDNPFMKEIRPQKEQQKEQEINPEDQLEVPDKPLGPKQKVEYYDVKGRPKYKETTDSYSPFNPQQSKDEPSLWSELFVMPESVLQQYDQLEKQKPKEKIDENEPSLWSELFTSPKTNEFGQQTDEPSIFSEIIVPKKTIETQTSIQNDIYPQEQSFEFEGDTTEQLKAQQQYLKLLEMSKEVSEQPTELERELGIGESKEEPIFHIPKEETIQEQLIPVEVQPPSKPSSKVIPEGNITLLPEELSESPIMVESVKSIPKPVLPPKTELGEQAALNPIIEETITSKRGRPRKEEEEIYEPVLTDELTVDINRQRLNEYYELTEEKGREDLADTLMLLKSKYSWAKDLRDKDGNKISRSKIIYDKEGKEKREKRNKAELKNLIDMILIEKYKRENSE